MVRSSIVQIWILPNGLFLLRPNSEGRCCPLYVKCAVTLAGRCVLWIGFPAVVGDRWTCSSSTESCLTSLFIFFNFNHLWAGCVSERYSLPSETEGSLPKWGSTLLLSSSDSEIQRKAQCRAQASFLLSSLPFSSSLLFFSLPKPL